MSGLLSTSEVMEFINWMSNVAHGFTHFCVHAFTVNCMSNVAHGFTHFYVHTFFEARKPFLISGYQPRSTVPETEKILEPGIVPLYLQKPWEELCPPEAVPWGNPKHLRVPVTTALTLSGMKTLEINGCTWKGRLWRRDEIKQVTALQKPLVCVIDPL